MNDDYEFEIDRDGTLIELGHLAWLVKYALRGEPSLSYGFMDGMAEAVFGGLGCSAADMIAIRAAMKHAVENAHSFDIDYGDVSEAREAAK